MSKSGLLTLLEVSGRIALPFYSLVALAFLTGPGGIFLVPLAGIIALVQFCKLALSEHHWHTNGIAAFLFWQPVILVEWLHPGTGVAPNGPVTETVPLILLLATGHAVIQATLRLTLEVDSKVRVGRCLNLRK